MSKLTIIVEESDEGGFTVTVAEMPGCISEGDTLRTAMLNAAEAIDLHTEDKPV